MPRWEYCHLAHSSRHIQLNRFAPDGPELTVVRPEGDEFTENAWMRAVARLGVDGWELVATVGQDKLYPALLFKRPLG